MNKTNGKKNKQSVSTTSGRIPPSDYESEQSVLGAILIDANALAKVIGFVKEESFYWEKHKIIFQSMLSLFKRNEPTDLVTVTSELKAFDKLEAIGGAYYLTELTEAVPFPRNVEYYAKIVQDKYVLRKIDEIGNTMGEESFEPDSNPDEILDRSITELFDLKQNKDVSGYRDFNSIAMETIDNLEILSKRKGSLTGISSGYQDLDNYTSGFQPSDLILLAARPSMGKTALALCFAYNATKFGRIPVGFISLEMSAKQIAMRLLSMDSKIPLYKIRNARMNDEDEWPRIVKSASNLASLPLYIDDSPTQTITDIRARARRLSMQKDVKFIIVDYLGLIQPSEKKESHQQMIADISRQLKGLAKELGLPVLSLAQLSRAPEMRGGSKVPILSDLRDSGALEQDADLVMFIYRKSYYDQKNREENDEDEFIEEDNTADVIIAKQRNGPTGSVKLVFLKDFTSFVNMDQTVGTTTPDPKSMSY